MFRAKRLMSTIRVVLGLLIGLGMIVFFKEMMLTQVTVRRIVRLCRIAVILQRHIANGF